MTDKHWLVLSKEDISPSKWFPLEKHCVKLPDGKIVDDYYLSPIGEVVMVLPFTSKKEVVLVQQYKHGIGEVMIELPGGMRQEGQSLLQSAANELEEETGILVELPELMAIGKVANNPTKTNQETYGYAVFDVGFNSKQRLDETEQIEVLVKPAYEVLNMVLKGEIWAADSVAIILIGALRYPSLFSSKSILTI